MKSFYLVIVVVSLVLSFFFSGSETAFVTVNKVRVEVWRRRKERVANIVVPFLKSPERFLYTTLIGNNIFNVAFATFATVYFNQYIDAEITWLLIVLAGLLLGEILPKTIFRSLADWLVRKISYPLEFFYWIFYPIIFVISKISEGILSLIGYRKGELHDFFSEKDVEILLNQSQDMVKQLDPIEGVFFAGIMSLRELWVREAMVPRTEIVALPETATLEQLMAVAEKYGYTRYPVFRDYIDNIVGIVLIRDLLLEPSTFQELIRPVMFVPEPKRCSELLSEFRQNNTSIAIVIDEHGGTAGLITAEDLVEELFGEIEDETDEQEKLIRQLDESTYRVNGRTQIEKLNEELQLDIPEGDYETLAGFLLTQFGHIPRRDEELEFKEVKFVITRATRRKIESVKIFFS